MPLNRLRTLRRGRLRTLLAHALLLVQVVVAFTAVVEGREGVGMRAHVEAQGSARHYAHAEANCAYCAARSIHATAAPVPAPPRVHAGHGLLRVALLIASPSAESAAPHQSRAPPVVA